MIYNHGLFSAHLKSRKIDYRVFDVKTIFEYNLDGSVMEEKDVIMFLVCIDGEFRYVPSSLFTHSNRGPNL